MAVSSLVVPKAGERVGLGTEPGTVAAQNSGIVLCCVADRFGDYALVLMDSGAVEKCHSVRSAPGIGWHYVKSHDEPVEPAPVRGKAGLVTKVFDVFLCGNHYGYCWASSERDAIARLAGSLVGDGAGWAAKARY